MQSRKQITLPPFRNPRLLQREHAQSRASTEPSDPDAPQKIELHPLRCPCQSPPLLRRDGEETTTTDHDASKDRADDLACFRRRRRLHVNAGHAGAARGVRYHRGTRRSTSRTAASSSGCPNRSLSAISSPPPSPTTRSSYVALSARGEGLYSGVWISRGCHSICDDDSVMMVKQRVLRGVPNLSLERVVAGVCDVTVVVGSFLTNIRAL